MLITPIAPHPITAGAHCTQIRPMEAWESCRRLALDGPPQRRGAQVEPEGLARALLGHATRIGRRAWRQAGEAGGGRLWLDGGAKGMAPVGVPEEPVQSAKSALTVRRGRGGAGRGGVP
eukprot:evm.model.scf_930.4 EVM.evm.TU.scf_930.4   scf_930:28770-29406(+)